MPYAISALKPDPTLEYDVTDAASGTPLRVTVMGGVVGLAPVQEGMFKVRSGGAAASRDPMGFFLPGVHPLPPGPDPLFVPEVYLTQVGVYDGDLKSTRMHGVGADAQAQVAPDPQRGGQRFVYLSFTCVGGEPMGVRYRVTMVRPRP